MLLPLFGLFTIAQASPSIYQRDIVSFPAVYVGQGFLNCGAPLVSDQCSTYPLNYSASTGQITFSIQAVSLTTINTTYSILSDNPQVTIPIDGYLALSGTFEVTLTSTPPAVRISLETSYTPTVTPAGTATATQLVPRAPLPTNIPRNLQPQKRSYDYDVCLGTPPDANLLTTSLVEVCHFVANAENYFVSLRSSSAAAYLPSWPGYIMQTVLCFMYFFSINQAFLQDPQMEKSPNYYFASITINALSVMFALFRTVLAIMTLQMHGGDWTTLPFISPILWLDWVTIYAVGGYAWAGFSFIGLIGTILMYAVCFWLTIGYGQLGYGTQQYEILNIPFLCTPSSVQFQTDPRRGNFVGLHVTTFTMSTIAILIAAQGIFYRGTLSAEDALKKSARWIIVILFILPQFIGLVIGAADHSHPYILIDQGGCFGSFVSGYRGYTELVEVPWIIKVSTIIGLNT